MTVRVTKSSSQVRPPSSCAFNLLTIHSSRVLAGSLSTVHAPKSCTSRLVTPVCVVKSKSKSTQTLDDYWKDLLEQLDIHPAPSLNVVRGPSARGQSTGPKTSTARDRHAGMTAEQLGELFATRN